MYGEENKKKKKKKITRFDKIKSSVTHHHIRHIEGTFDFSEEKVPSDAERGDEYKSYRLITVTYTPIIPIIFA